MWTVVAFQPLRKSTDHLAERAIVIIDIKRLNGMNARLYGSDH